MQFRMRTHQLPTEEIEALLSRAQTASLATVNPDGTPYVVPVHFVRMGDVIYVHGLPAGQKVENIKANAHVCLTAYEMQGLLPDEEGRPCETNTAYVSAVICGKAEITPIYPYVVPTLIQWCLNRIAHLHSSDRAL